MKKFLSRWWRLLTAALLAAAAVAVLYFGCVKTEMQFRTEQDDLSMEIGALQSQIELNQQYADVQEQITAASQAIQDSRSALYRHFPADLLQEDQILYVLYLEQLFRPEQDKIEFGTVEPAFELSDKASLGHVELTVEYTTTYQQFKDLISFLATDDHITSIPYCTLEHNEDGTVTGDLTIWCYTLNANPYTAPDVPKPNTGKPSIFD